LGKVQKLHQSFGKIRKIWVNQKQLGEFQHPHSILDQLEKLHSSLGKIRNIFINCMGGGTFIKVGGTSARQKIIQNFCRLNWQL